ncbi:MAG: lipoprotein [Gammaproteobacteria bacterium]|nr:lipoprotein [Gammaproteobacteria bacterium]
MKRRHRFASLFAAIVVTGAALAGCGQMGPLSLPEPPAAESDDRTDDQTDDQTDDERGDGQTGDERSDVGAE